MDDRTPTPVYTDAHGEQWDLTLDAVMIQRVRETYDLDLANITDPTAWQRLDADLVLQVDVLHCLLLDQCETKGVNAAAFAKSLGPGEVLDNAYMALLDAIENFTPPRRRSLWRALCQKTQKIQTMGLEMAIDKVNSTKLEEQVRTEMARAMDSAVQTQLTRLHSVTPMPENSESAPAG